MRIRVDGNASTGVVVFAYYPDSSKELLFRGDWRLGTLPSAFMAEALGGRHIHNSLPGRRNTIYHIQVYWAKNQKMMKYKHRQIFYTFSFERKLLLTGRVGASSLYDTVDVFSTLL